MPGILIERGGFLREIFRALGTANWDCQWLVTCLECYDTQGWLGCEKWREETLFLANRNLLRDVEARDMQFVWGIFSAIPAGYSREEIVSYPLPTFEDNAGRSIYLRERLVPQHPLAFLEIACEDSSSVTAVAWEAERLLPLYGLACWTEDVEEMNRRYLTMERVVWQLKEAWGFGVMDDHTRRNLCYYIWRSLYHHHPERLVRRSEVEAAYLRLWKGEG